MDSLSSPSSLLALKTSSSDADVLTATAGSTAVPGSYAIEVTRLAQAQKLVAGGQASASTAIGNGTVSIEIGTISGGTLNSTTGTYSGATFANSGELAKSITIDASNNTLAGIRDAINAANAGVTASIVNDGGTNPYHLVLTSNRTGASRSAKISVNGDAALSNLLFQDPQGSGTQNLAERVTAQNAQFKVDGLAVSTASNTVTDVIDDVTLSLAKVNTGAPVTLTVARDQNAVTNQVKSLADAYNTVQNALRALASYDPSTKKAGPLYADGTTSEMGSSIRSILTAQLVGAGRYTNLSQLGLAFQRDGTLKLDAAKLQAAMTAAPADVAAALAQAGSASDSMVGYTSAGSATKAGSYTLNITQLASRGTSVGSAAANLTISAGVNDTLNVSLDGVSTTVTLGPGTYASADALAQEVQARINGATALATAGASISAIASGGVLTLTSLRYGAVSAVQVTGGNGAADLLGATPTNAAGLNVAGTIGGVAGIGNGQTLTGFAGSPVEGLQLAITSGATGSRGTVNYSRGFAYQLSQLAKGFLDSAGTIANRTNGISTSLKDIGKQRDTINARLTLIEARYRKQYSTLDGVLAGMQTTQNYLSQQITMLQNLTSSK
jgi:flagellar hook-associated protein 2